MRYPFESDEALLLNKQIFETIYYYGALEASCELAAELGTYETYKGSPVSQGRSTEFPSSCSHANRLHGPNTRRVLSGEFQIVNQHLLRDLTDMDLWDDEMKQNIIADNGSVQNIPQIPDDIKKLYKTVWEISQKTVLQMAADRGAFIDQSQSLNIHIAQPNYGKNLHPCISTVGNSD
ncbi:RRM1 [Lepeophtheirus salmonis]|uniref:RRM1 n=1 Tax=Lepeophtheirus salmonis TaxID=72036 RepID=A0A7R8D0Q5_LEPSM|nr:RRM1 [Lepeophtheirus salmonis]CAF2986907.1 RRM1 [Lepeophtheirus salmonis]